MVIAFVSDLMFTGKIKEAALGVGAMVRFVKGLEEFEAALLEAEPLCIILDLEARRFDPMAMLRLVRDRLPATPIVAFFSHVKEELAAAAEQGGASMVMARSQFVRELPRLLR